MANVTADKHGVLVISDVSYLNQNGEVSIKSRLYDDLTIPQLETVRDHYIAVGTSLLNKSLDIIAEGNAKEKIGLLRTLTKKASIAFYMADWAELVIFNRKQKMGRRK